MSIPLKVKLSLHTMKHSLFPLGAHTVSVMPVLLLQEGKFGLMAHLYLNLVGKLTVPAVISLITFKLFTRRHEFIRQARREKAAENPVFKKKKLQSEDDVYIH